MPNAKRKISIFLDEDLIAELETSGQSISAQINTAVREDLRRRRRRCQLTALLDQLEEEQGPVGERMIQKYAAMLC